MDTLRRAFKPSTKPDSLSESKRTSKRFRDSVHVIPTPGVETRRPEEYVRVPLQKDFHPAHSSVAIEYMATYLEGVWISSVDDHHWCRR